MGTPRHSVRRRWLIWCIALVVGAIAVVAVVRTFVLRDRARTVPVEEAVEEFRAATTTPAPSTAADPPASAASTPPTTPPTATTATPPETAAGTIRPALPEEGVYVYRTAGGEQIDALGGASHAYPAETTITVVADGCGVRLRWDALRERRDEWRLCRTDDGIELQPDGVQYHEFFGQPERETLVCDRAVLIVPIGPPPTEPVPQSCMLADDPWMPVWTVGDESVRVVEGGEVAVRHVRMTIDDADDYWERLSTDWYLAESGLPVEVVTTKESRSPSPIGGVVYRESYRLELVSTTPQR